MNTSLPAALQAELQQIAATSQRPFADVCAEARQDLLELASVRSTLGAWMFARLSRFVRRRGYGQVPIHDLAELQMLRQALRSGSQVFLVTHKTYLDFFVLFEFFYQHGMTPPRIFGGANMAFAGFGALARRAGGIFIRRSFKDDAIYKAALSQSIANLLHQKESFMWAIEGTRSRTGKLLIPRLGLLHYVTEAAKTLGNQLGDEVVSFIPVGVVYDRIPDVADMAAQEAGAGKQRESLAWFFRYLRKLRGRHGDIHVRFGAPIALGETPDAPDLAGSSTDSQQAQIAVQKLAFEACFRINEVTPATMTSLVLLSLLCRGTASVASIKQDVAVLQSFMQQMHPAAQGQQPSRGGSESPAQCIAALQRAGLLQASDGLSAGNSSGRGSLGRGLRRDSSSAESSPGLTLQLQPQSLSEAIYYSNMAAHHFLIPAFAELALALLVQRTAGFSIAEFEAQCLALRELFKFEFFFSRKALFRLQLEQELAQLGLPDAARPGIDSAALLQCLRAKPIRLATGVLAPYLAAYRAIAERLASDSACKGLDDAQLQKLCLEAARSRAELPAAQPQVRRAVRTAERPAKRPSGVFRPVLSLALLANGIRVADSRGLRADQNDATRQDRCRTLISELDEIEEALAQLLAMNR